MTKFSQSNFRAGVVRWPEEEMRFFFRGKTPCLGKFAKLKGRQSFLSGLT